MSYIIQYYISNNILFFALSSFRIWASFQHLFKKSIPPTCVVRALCCRQQLSLGGAGHWLPCPLLRVSKALAGTASSSPGGSQLLRDGKCVFAEGESFPQLLCPQSAYYSQAPGLSVLTALGTRSRAPPLPSPIGVLPTGHSENLYISLCSRTNLLCDFGQVPYPL